MKGDGSEMVNGMARKREGRGVERGRLNGGMREEAGLVDKWKMAYTHRREETLQHDVLPKGRMSLVKLVRFTRGRMTQRWGQ